MSGKRYLLDTNAIVALLKGSRALVTLLQNADWVGISVISQIEFLAFSDLSEDDRQLFEEFLKRVEVINLLASNNLLIEQIIQIRLQYRVKLPDAIIASTALQTGATLVTADQEFTLALTNQTKRKENLDAAENTLNENKIKLEQAQSDANTADSILKQYSPGGERLKQLQEISESFSAWDLLQEQIDTAKGKMVEVASNIQKADKVYQDSIANLEDAKTTFTQKLQLLQKAEENNQKIIQENYTIALRQFIHDGDNCPVCNGIYHEQEVNPLLETPLIDTTELSQEKQDAEETKQAAELAKTKAETSLNKFKEKESDISENLESLQAQLALLKNKITLAIKTNDWEVTSLKAELKALQDSDSKYNLALTTQKDSKVALREAEQNWTTSENTCNTTLLEYEATTKEVERWQEQLNKIEATLDELTQGKSYSDLSAELQTEKEEFARIFQKANEENQELEKAVIKFKVEHDKAINFDEEACKQNEQVQKNWKISLASTSFTEESFLSSQAQPETQTEWQEEIETYQKKQLQLETIIGEVRNTIANRATDELTINSLRDTKLALEKQHQQQQDNYTSLTIWIQQVELKRQQAEKLNTELLSTKQKAETYGILARNLKTDEFQAYILEYLETELVTRATKVLQELTDSRYSLRIQEGDYFVEDNWNCGESRRVQTLSGGETFATSLSMALALSEKLSLGAQLGSLFLDEGFGTLDAETLETVHGILESLRQQDKLIGVITHVKALGQRLPQVKVSKSPEGSRVDIETF